MNYLHSCIMLNKILSSEILYPTEFIVNICFTTSSFYGVSISQSINHYLFHCFSFLGHQHD